MRAQNQIKRTLRGASAQVGVWIGEHPELSRSAVARGLCEVFGFFDPTGRAQQASCLKALRELEAEGAWELPASRFPRREGPRPRRLREPVARPSSVPEQVEQIEALRVRLVQSEADSRQWNELILREHPFGSRPLVGRQLRYLVESEQGALGAVGFSASALRLEPRDEWIGWSREQREAHLDRVVCLSRFLIRPGLQCRNLASKVLGMVLGVFPADFEARYGYRPWLLETFVEPAHHDGASVRAANWVKVGRSRGRGRQDRTNQANQTPKDVYLYLLDETFRQQLGLPESRGAAPLAPGEGLEEDQWAGEEFGAAELGDRRLTRRLVSIAQIKGRFPGLPFLEAVHGQAAAVAGYYRFFDQPERSRVRMEEILGPHRERTLRRMADQAAVLCLHDTTDLNYSTLLACEGLGVIGKNQTATESGGLRLHSSYVVSAEEGLPLGVLSSRCYAPELKPEHRGRDSRLIPIETKETYRWIENLTECIAAEDSLGQVRVTHVMDREGDFFELFHAWREQSKDALLVRAKHNRSRMKSEGGVRDAKLFDHVEQLEAMGAVEVEVPRKSPRPKKGQREAPAAQPKRTATLELRWMPTEIHPPKHGLSAKHPPVPLWILEARESDLGGVGAKPIHWRLLTTIEITDEHTAIELLGAYAKRWRIEDWHRILKTCCRVEEPAHRDAESLKRLVAINMVVAWRIHLMTLLGRELPDLPGELLFSDVDLRVLSIRAKQLGLAPPRNLGQAVLVVARLGGYMNRKHDPPPGAEILWRGLRALTLLSQGFALAQLE